MRTGRDKDTRNEYRRSLRFPAPRQEIESHMIGARHQGESAADIRPKGSRDRAPGQLALEAAIRFVAGRMADGKIGEGLAKEERLPEGHLGKGSDSSEENTSAPPPKNRARAEAAGPH